MTNIEGVTVSFINESRGLSIVNVEERGFFYLVVVSMFLQITQKLTMIRSCNFAKS